MELDALGALCQTAVSRETAYALIYQLCKSDQPNLGTVQFKTKQHFEGLLEAYLKNIE